MDKLNMLDILLSYENDSDKIAILGRAIEKIIDYSEQIDSAFSTVNENIQLIANALMMLEEEVRRINGELIDLKKNVISNITKLEDTVTTSVSKLESTVIETTQRTPETTVSDISVAAPVVASTAGHNYKTNIIEENLVKPSQIGESFGSNASGTGSSPLGGGMSIRRAMMAEIKQQLQKSKGSSPTGGPGGESKIGEIGSGYIPKIHQPRKAKTLGGGLVKKMNKLLDVKFQKMSPSIDKLPNGLHSARSPLKAPPSAYPSKKDNKKKKKKK
ncbi:MAG: hypothetical protein ACFFD2_01735 [Promethearchaeota archaeon]